jgi:hypothetical protein
LVFDAAVEAFRQRRIGDALELFCRAETAGHDPDECAGYRWLCRMLHGCFEEAWKESDRISADRISARGAPDPLLL